MNNSCDRNKSVLICEKVWYLVPVLENNRGPLAYCPTLISLNFVAKEEKSLGVGFHKAFRRWSLLQASGDIHCVRHILRTGVRALVWRAWPVVGQRCSLRALTLSTVWAVGNDMTRFLTAKTLHRPSSTARKRVYGAVFPTRPSSGKYSPATATIVICSAPSRNMPASTHASPVSLNMSMRKSIFLASGHSSKQWQM